MGGPVDPRASAAPPPAGLLELRTATLLSRFPPSALLRSVLQHLPPPLTIAAHLLAALPQARGQRAFIGGPEAWVEVREQEAAGRSTSALARPHGRLRGRD